MIQANKKDAPSISIIVPTYNRPQMLSRALNSISRQTFSDYEVIVVNDAGCDVSDIIAECNNRRIKLINHPTNKGLAGSRNTGIRASEGEYIAYLDDDDIYYPHHLETLYLFAELYYLRFVYSYCVDIIEDEYGNMVDIAPRSFPPYHPSLVRKQNFIPVCTIMHKRNILFQSGLFDESITYAEDWDLWYRCSKVIPFSCIPTVTCEYRKRHTNDNMNAASKTAVNASYLSSIKKEKYNIIPSIRAVHGIDVPQSVIRSLVEWAADKQFYIYGAGSHFEQIYPHLNQHIKGIFDCKAARFQKKTHLPVFSPDQLSIAQSDLILSTVVDNIYDVLMTTAEYNINPEQLFFLDDFYFDDNVLVS